MRHPTLSRITSLHTCASDHPWNDTLPSLVGNAMCATWTHPYWNRRQKAFFALWILTCASRRTHSPAQYRLGPDWLLLRCLNHRRIIAGGSRRGRHPPDREIQRRRARDSAKQRGSARQVSVSDRQQRERVGRELYCWRQELRAGRLQREELDDHRQMIRPDRGERVGTEIGQDLLGKIEQMR